jgi:hypothetical protein
VDGKAVAVRDACAGRAVLFRNPRGRELPPSKLNFNNGIADTGWPVGMAVVGEQGTGPGPEVR